ncbi:unnamed protein product [Dibothriocephalus latus]|uniref:Uncharacterized protein n=1 Tax=Dibothriocephalus latus TaxID=60516 RepID=A0A3P6T899_DIBLA|nr:unnamed protein product [Dibothriocephalus latus]
MSWRLIFGVLILTLLGLRPTLKHGDVITGGACTTTGDGKQAEQNLSMDEFVHSLSDNLISWNEYAQAVYETKAKGGKQNGLLVNTRNLPLVKEYVKVDCHLVCWIQTVPNPLSSRGFSENQRNLVCKHIVNATNFMQHSSQSAVTVKCTAHQSAIRAALMSTVPTPETLYLTLEISVAQLHHEDFKHLSVWLRRLSLQLGHTTSIDKGILTPLRLDSFKAEDCEDAGLSVTNDEDSSVCSVEFIFFCPDRDYFALAADQTTLSKHCGKKEARQARSEMLQNDQAIIDLNAVSTRRTARSVPQADCCSCEDVKSIVAAFTRASLVSDASTCSKDDESKRLLFLSLWTNVILGTLLLIVLILVCVSSVRLRRICKMLVTKDPVQRPDGR